MYVRTCVSFKSVNHKKKFGPANRKFAKSHICGRFAKFRICHLRNFTGGPPTFTKRADLAGLDSWSLWKRFLEYASQVEPEITLGPTPPPHPPPATQREYCTAVEAFYLLYLGFLSFPSPDLVLGGRNQYGGQLNELHGSYPEFLAFSAAFLRHTHIHCLVRGVKNVDFKQFYPPTHTNLVRTLKAVELDSSQNLGNNLRK
jgi:hypothetical protein